MNLLHDDHTACGKPRGVVAVASLGSHNAGTPCTTLTKGCACDSYSFRTIDSLGVTTRAEW